MRRDRVREGSSAPGQRAALVGRFVAMASVLAAAVGMLGAGSAAAATGNSGGSERARAAQPNVIVINTDDQATSTMSRRVMPYVDRLVVEGGVSFSDSVVATPLCCPSRSVFLTGQYGHNNGVLWNVPGYSKLIDPRNTLPVWMRRAGYRTIHLGKYLNGYKSAAAEPTTVAPGWSSWFTAVDPNSYYGGPVAIDGADRLRRSGDRPRDNITAQINRRARAAVRRWGPGDRPLFMVLDQFVPHQSSAGVNVPRCRTPGPEPLARDRNLFRGAPLPRPPSFNESDVSDKPSFVRTRQPIDAGLEAEIERTYRCGLAALRGVDRGVGQIWKQLGKIGERRNTALIFTSDNGFLFGQHRIREAKVFPYREALEVPLAIRLPAAIRGAGAARGSTARQTVANVDLAPTILGLAGAEPCRSAERCRTLDGRSLVGLARGRSGGWPEQRAIPIELDVGLPKAPPGGLCSYQGLWDGLDSYITYTSLAAPDGSCAPSSETEHYDLGADPYELENLFGTAPPGGTLAARQAELASRAAALARCQGIAGRDPDPTADGGTYCE